MKRQGPGAGFVRILLVLAAGLTVALVLNLIFTPQVFTLKGTSSSVPGEDWPTYLHDIQRSGASSETVLSPANAGSLDRLWAFKTGAGVAASASVVNGTVYFGSWDGYEYALDALKGYQKWKTYLGQTKAFCAPPVLGVTSAAAVVNNVVYVGGGDAYWYALDAYTGQVLWRVMTGDNSADGGYYNWSSPLVYAGFAYVGTASDCGNPLAQGELLKVDLRSHQIVSTLKVVPDGQVGGGIATTPVIDITTHTIYVTTGSGESDAQAQVRSIVAINATTMQVQSSWQLPSSLADGNDTWQTTPNLIADGWGSKLIEASDESGFTYAFDPINLSAGPLWRVQTGLSTLCTTCADPHISSAAFGNGLLYVAGGKTLINGVGYKGVVRALDPATGKYIWEHGDPAPIVSSLAYVNGLVIASEGNDLELLDAKTGARLYNYEIGTGIEAPASLSHGQIFVGALDGYLYSFGLKPPSELASDAHCPASWFCQDVGNPRARGTGTYAGDRWSLAGNGIGIADVSDQFHFVNQPISGDIQLKANIVTQQATSRGSEAALMIRQSLAQDAPFYAASLSPAGVLTVEYRTAFSGALTVLSSVTGVTASTSLEIQRVGDQFDTAVAQNGQTYALVPGSTIGLPLPIRTFTGLAASSGINGTAGLATYSAIVLSRPGVLPVAAASPSPCPAPWNCSDVGNPVTVGDQTLLNGTFTVKGAGQDVWGNEDEFHFVWQPVSGDAAMSAHLLSQGNTNADAKAGVMLRAGTDANAPYYAAFVKPDQGFVVQYRLLPGLDAQLQFSTGPLPTPVYLKVARVGNLFTTYTSRDGVVWQAIVGSQISLTMGSTVLAGLVVTSHSSSNLSLVTFNMVKVGKS